MIKILDFTNENAYYQGDVYELDRFYYDRFVLTTDKNVQQIFYAYTEDGFIINIGLLDKRFIKLMVEGKKGLITINKRGSIRPTVEYENYHNFHKKHEIKCNREVLYWLDKHGYILPLSIAVEKLIKGDLSFSEYKEAR